jgi:hypothetical protein
LTKLIFLFLLSVSAFAQSVTIPAQTVVTPVTINGTAVNITITIPAQTVALPATSLPSGFTWANGVLTVPGSISATSVSLTGGSALPTCASNLYLWQYSAGELQPYCYVAPTLTIPGITVSQATSAINTITLTP